MEHPFHSNSQQFKASDFGDLALKSVDEAIAQCGDDVPPLCVLQALILTTHWVIVRGVRGRAWRYVGLCVRVAFELGLHITDAEVMPGTVPANPDKWCEEEERRRAYWAVWEMDQFTSHIKHIPITIDWAQYDVCLPAEDHHWFQGLPQRSCPFSGDLLNRSKHLHATGNKSPRAWFIVIASLNAEANELAYPLEKIHRRFGERALAHADRRKALFNAIQLSLILLPQGMRFHGQHLDFGTQTMGLERNPSVLHIQSSIYLIAMLPETSKIIALRPYVFEAYKRQLLDNAQRLEAGAEVEELGELPGDSARKVEQCCKAADAVLNIVVNCHESHYKYVSPYVAQVSWLAATVPLLQQELVEDESQKLVIRSKFEILKATVNRFVEHWEMSRVPIQNLDTLELRLRQFTAAWKGVQPKDRPAARASTKRQPKPGVPSSRSDIGQSTTPNWISESEENIVLGRPEGFSHDYDHRNDYIHTRNVPLPQSSLVQSCQVTLPDTRPHISSFALSGHSQEIHSHPKATFPLEDVNFDPLCEAGFQQASIAGLESDPLDWLSFFNDADINGDLTDWFSKLPGWEST